MPSGKASAGGAPTASEQFNQDLAMQGKTYASGTEVRVTLPDDMPNGMLQEILNTNSDYSNRDDAMARAKKTDRAFNMNPIVEEPVELVESPVSGYTPDNKRLVNAIKVLGMNGLTIEDMKESDAGIKAYNDLLDSKAQYPEDAFVHALAEANRTNYPNDPSKAEEMTNTQLAVVGFDTDLLQLRASTYNKFANGTALTVVQGYNGIKNFFGMIGESGAKATSVHMEEILANMAREDSALYESLKPTTSANPFRGGELNLAELDKNYKPKLETVAGTDIATTAGKAAPLVAGGYLGGTGAGGVILADIVPALAVTAGDPDATEIDKAIALLSPIGGMALANSLSKWTKTQYKSVQEFEEAIRAEPHLIEDLTRMAKDKKIKLKDLKAFDRPDDLPSRTSNEMWFRSSAGVSPKEATEGLEAFKIDMREAVESGIENYATPKELRTVRSDILITKYTNLEVAKFFKHQASTIAGMSKNADEFLENVIAYEELFNAIDMKPLVAWAKNTQKLSGGARNDAIEQAGVNGLLLASGNPAIANILPTFFTNWANKLGKSAYMGTKKVLTKPILGTKLKDYKKELF